MNIDLEEACEGEAPERTVPRSGLSAGSTTSVFHCA